MDNKDLYSYSVAKKTATITEFKTAVEGEIAIPARLGSFPVTAIGTGALGDCKRLTKLMIPGGFEEFNGWLYQECPALTEIVVGEKENEYSSVDGVLFDKNKTKLIKYPSGHPRTHYRIPDTVQEIDIQAFDSYCHLTDFEVGENNKFFSSKDGILYNKDGTCLVRYPIGRSQTSFRVPDGVQQLRAHAFFGTKSITQITLSDSVRDTGDLYYGNRLSAIHVGAGNPYLEVRDGILFNKKRKELIFCPVNNPLTDYCVPDDIRKINGAAFENCRHLRSLVVPTGAGFEHAVTFRGCTSLEKVVICSGEPVVHNREFAGCTALRSIALPAGIACIYPHAFDDCKSLRDVWFAGTKRDWRRSQFYHDNECFERAAVHLECDLDDVIGLVGD